MGKNLLKGWETGDLVSQLIRKNVIETDVAETELDYSVVENNVSENQKTKLPPPHPILAEKAEMLGNDRFLMDSYVNFETKKQNWFFSQNPNLLAKVKKPAKFSKKADWEEIYKTDGFKPRQVLSDLAEFDNFKDIDIRDDDHFEKLLNAYNAWRPDLYAYFWATEEDSGETAYTCNVFVGDVLFLADKQKINSQKKYYSAKDIYQGIGKFIEVEKSKVERGDIVTFYNGGHVEIVTEIYDSVLGIGPKAFCSRGGGRGRDNGEESCGFSLIGTQR